MSDPTSLVCFITCEMRMTAPPPGCLEGSVRLQHCCKIKQSLGLVITALNSFLGPHFRFSRRGSLWMPLGFSSPSWLASWCRCCRLPLEPLFWAFPSPVCAQQNGQADLPAEPALGPLSKQYVSLKPPCLPIPTGSFSVFWRNQPRGTERTLTWGCHWL